MTFRKQPLLRAEEEVAIAASPKDGELMYLAWGLNALFVADGEDSVLSPALAALSGRVGLQVDRLGPLQDAELEIAFTPGRYNLSTVTGTFVDGLLAGGELSVDGDVLAGADIFADLTVEVVGAAPHERLGQPEQRRDRRAVEQQRAPASRTAQKNKRSPSAPRLRDPVRRAAMTRASSLARAQGLGL